MQTSSAGALGGALACFVDLEAARVDARSSGRAGTGSAAGGPGRRVVVGVGDGDLRVVEEAARRAADGTTTLLLVHAHGGRGRRWRQPDTDGPLGPGDACEGGLSAAAAALRHAGMAAAHECRHGPISHALAASAHAHGAHEIVVGAPRRAAFGRRLGAVARALRRRAGCPVVVAR